MPTPREHFLQTLAGARPTPIPWGEHGMDCQVIGKAFGVTFDPIPGTPPDWEACRAIIERTKRINALTGGAVVSIPRYFTMAPRIRKPDNSGELTDEASLGKLVFVKFTPAHWDTVKRIVDAKGEYAVSAEISLGIGHIWQTMDLMAFAVATVENPGLIRTILERYTAWTCEAVENCRRIGVDLIWSFDDFAFGTGLVYSPSFFREMVLPYARRVAAAIRGPWVFHSDGNYMEVLDDIAGLGMSAINPVEPGSMDIPEIRRRHPRLTLIGNVLVDVLGRGTPQQARDEVDRVYRELGGTGPFLPASSNSVPEWAKPENVRAMLDRHRELAGT
ncbi:MAG: uroporphyrinogen decarboxylase family protein [Planctomycetota bacterium]